MRRSVTLSTPRSSLMKMAGSGGTSTEPHMFCGLGNPPMAGVVTDRRVQARVEANQAPQVGCGSTLLSR